MNIFLQYPKCTTCKKAKKYLMDNNIEFKDRHIVESNPTENELRAWHLKSGLPIKRFFNTSGLVYKELGLKDKLDTMSDDEKYKLLSSNGMLVKRPLIINDEMVLVGFKEKDWEALANDL